MRARQQYQIVGDDGELIQSQPVSPASLTDEKSKPYKIVDASIDEICHAFDHMWQNPQDDLLIRTLAIKGMPFYATDMMLRYGTERNRITTSSVTLELRAKSPDVTVIEWHPHHHSGHAEFAGQAAWVVLFGVMFGLCAIFSAYYVRGELWIVAGFAGVYLLLLLREGFRFLHENEANRRYCEEHHFFDQDRASLLNQLEMALQAAEASHRLAEQTYPERDEDEGVNDAHQGHNQVRASLSHGRD